MGNLTYDFTDRTVIVTGAARGIGHALINFFQQAGAGVYALGPNRESLEKAAAETGARAIVADVSSTTDVEHAIATVVEETGQVDVLINNAGILRDRMLWKLSDTEWDDVLAVHASGTFKLTRACVPHFRRRKYGRVVNMTSYSGMHGNTGQVNYSAAKAAVVGFTRAAAKELALFGVTVNAISPAAATRMVASMPEAKRALLTAHIPMARFAEPAEICAAVAFLASEEAHYVTGAVLPVDGGMSI
jgi:3-oxoacyl-[acyl-carrier protein] reductase